jgi:hypothetical protein
VGKLNGLTGGRCALDRQRAGHGRERTRRRRRRERVEGEEELVSYSRDVDDLASWSGWCAAVLVLAAALVPLGYRTRLGRRASPTSRAIGVHVVTGLAASLGALLHTLAGLPALGSPASVRGGMSALGPAAVAFFLLFAHVGVGLKLRDPALRDRVRFRRRHFALAVAIAIGVGAHVVALLRAA